MNYYIGIDGGGTKTKYVLSDENLNILYEGQSEPSNFLTIGTETVSYTILNIIKECCKTVNISTNQLKATLLGTTGAGRENDALNLEEAVYSLAKEEAISLIKFKVVSDARIALEAAFPGNPGAILIAGTGSIMFGKDSEGNIHRVGGFGRLIGDEGSGLIIGKKGLNIISKFFDGRGKESHLIKKVEQIFEIYDQNSLITKVYSDLIKLQDVAPLVIESAEEGDELCRNILDDETNELLLHIAAMSKHLNDLEINIVFIGSTITNDNFYSQMLREKIKMFLPKVNIKTADYPPEIGAVIMAKQLGLKL